MAEKFWQESFSELLEIILCLVTDLLSWTQHKKHPGGALWLLFLSSIHLFIKLLNICLTPLAKRMFSLEYKNGLFLSRALQCPTEILFSLQVVFDSGTPWTAAHQASLSPGVCSNSCLLSLWCHPTNSSSAAPFFCLPSFPASEFFPMSRLYIRWPKYWSCSFSISPSNEYSGLIFFGIDWFDLLAVQGTLKSLLQHHS